MVEEVPQIQEAQEPRVSDEEGEPPLEGQPDPEENFDDNYN